MENIMTFVAEPNETVRGDRVYKQMSDGTIRVEPTKIFPGNQFGDYVVIKGEPTEEEI